MALWDGSGGGGRRCAPGPPAVLRPASAARLSSHTRATAPLAPCIARLALLAKGSNPRQNGWRLGGWLGCRCSILGLCFGSGRAHGRLRLTPGDRFHLEIPELNNCVPLVEPAMVADARLGGRAVADVAAPRPRSRLGRRLLGYAASAFIALGEVRTRIRHPTAAVRSMTMTSCAVAYPAHRDATESRPSAQNLGSARNPGSSAAGATGGCGSRRRRLSLVQLASSLGLGLVWGPSSEPQQIFG